MWREIKQWNSIAIKEVCVLLSLEKIKGGGEGVAYGNETNNIADRAESKLTASFSKLFCGIFIRTEK